MADLLYADLARYTHRVVISNKRIATIDATHVAIGVRADARGGKPGLPQLLICR